MSVQETIEYKLKEAGFPQEPKSIIASGIDVELLGGNYIVCLKESECGMSQLRKEEWEELQKSKNKYTIKSPTIEELVEECSRFGLEFGEGMPAFRMKLEGGQVEKSRGWIAVELEGSCGGETDKQGEGETLKEAVANLWLKLASSTYKSRLKDNK